jgi:ABC-2 type transport system permease protein
MGSWTITKWELKNTLNSKKFLLIFFFQLVVLVVMIMFFNGFMVSIESQQGLTITPSLNQFASVDVVDPQNIIKNQLNPEILLVSSTGQTEALNNINNGRVTGVVLLNSSSTDLDKIQPLQVQLLIDYADPKRSVVRYEVQAARDKAASILSQQWINSLASSQNATEPQVQQETQGESLPLQLIKKVMTAILLFLPLFLFGNMVIDSLVGEKERKTGEILIAMPVSRAYIVLGKCLAVIITMALQAALWIMIMLLAGFPVQNAILVYLIVVLTAVPIVGLTAIIASYAKNYKEAGIGIGFAYIAIIGFLIVPALAYVSQQGKYVSMSTMTLAIKVFSGEAISWGDIALPLAILLMLSIISYGISIWLYERDDIVFGPRPGLLKLLINMIGIKKL